MSEKKLTLETMESKQEHLGRGLVSIASSDLDFLEITSGGFVSVGNSKKLILRAIRAEEEFKGKMGIDGETRHVLGISLGEEICVSKSNEVPKILKSIEISILENENSEEEELKKSIIPSL